VPSETFSHSSTTTASRSEVWSALDRPSTWEGIGGVDRVINPVIDEKGRLQGFTFETLVAGTKYLGKATPNAREEGQMVALNIANSEIRGAIRIDLSDDGDGTLIRVTLDVESAGVLSAMLFPMIARSIGNGLPRATEAFAASFAHSP
jgi:hypothetical protein